MWENSKFAYSYPPDDKSEWWHIFYITPTQKERQSTEQLSKHIVMLMEKSIGEPLTNIFDVIAETEHYRTAHKSGNTMKCRNYLSIGAQKVINASDFHLPIVADMLSHWYNLKFLGSIFRAESHAAVALTEAMDKYLSINTPGQTSDNPQLDLRNKIDKMAQQCQAKKCLDCGITLDISQFPKSRDYVKPYCRPCIRIRNKRYQKTWREKHPEAYRKRMLEVGKQNNWIK